MTNLDYLKSALGNENLNTWTLQDLQAINNLPYLGNYINTAYEPHIAVFMYDTDNGLITLVSPSNPMEFLLLDILRKTEPLYQEPRFKVYEGTIETILDKDTHYSIEPEDVDWEELD